MPVSIEITDKDGKPAVGKSIVVRWNDGKKTFKTDKEGKFEVHLTAGMASDLEVEIPRGLSAKTEKVVTGVTVRE